MNPSTNPVPRLFAALSLPVPIKEELESRTRLLQQKLPFRKWTHPEDIHVTLFFHGPVSPPLVDKVKAELADASRLYTPFELAMQGLGTFGPPHSPRILYAGVQGDVRSLSDLAGAIHRRMGALGFSVEERPYTPHITLAKRYEGDGDPKAILQHEAEEGSFALPLPWLVDSITLYQSHLNRSPMYEPIARFPLNHE
ncbi:RNA 2',3'-cyclic phosphodiesterase [Gorillibacterium sp. CAU 1737]|uniref:RNA 2',3'-cyclic phosphodiesterase n=1 Tax=Gorillibacterium sp. CAU 1737 TaxID=3140362 RepID=UPI003261C8B7